MLVAGTRRLTVTVVGVHVPAPVDSAGSTAVAVSGSSITEPGVAPKLAPVRLRVDVTVALDPESNRTVSMTGICVGDPIALGTISQVP